jgi:hypothetical protein
MVIIKGNLIFLSTEHYKLFALPSSALSIQSLSTTKVAAYKS